MAAETVGIAQNAIVARAAGIDVRDSVDEGIYAVVHCVGFCVELLLEMDVCVFGFDFDIDVTSMNVCDFDFDFDVDVTSRSVYEERPRVLVSIFVVACEELTSWIERPTTGVVSLERREQVSSNSSP